MLKMTVIRRRRVLNNVTLLILERATQEKGETTVSFRNIE